MKQFAVQPTKIVQKTFDTEGYELTDYEIKDFPGLEKLIYNWQKTCHRKPQRGSIVTTLEESTTLTYQLSTGEISFTRSSDHCLQNDTLKSIGITPNPEDSVWAEADVYLYDGGQTIDIRTNSTMNGPNMAIEMIEGVIKEALALI